MFKNILVPTDGSMLSDKAMNAAIELALNNPGCTIVGLAFAEPMPNEVLDLYPFMDTTNYDVHEQLLAEKRAEKMALKAEEAGISCETIVKKSAQPHDDIINTARHYDSDCIFMPGLDRDEHGNYFIGVEIQKLLRQANIPVLVYR